MEVLGIRMVSNPTGAILALGFITGGVGLGTASGLVPGLHVNTLAILLAALAPQIPAAPHLVGAALLAAGVVHSFLDIVPTLAIGVPDAAMAVSALPGHRLVLGGRGREALRLSALGSGGAILTAVVLGLPVTWLMSRVAPLLIEHLRIVLLVVAALMVLTERSKRARVGGVLAILASGGLGLLTLDLEPESLLPGGDMLLPLLAGLFGIPVLVLAARGGGLPPQSGTTLATDRRQLGQWSLVGAVSGAVVAYVPGVSAAVAAVLAFIGLPGEATDRGFIVAISGVNTANTVFALFALLALGAPRTGVLVAFERASLPPNLPLLLVAILIAAAAGLVLVPVLGDRYLDLVGNADSKRLSIGVGLLIAVLTWVFTGPLGVFVLGVSALIGHLPIYFDSRRVHLMGVLFVPLAVG
ncbi:tripartite tricarboxylate transporter permease [Halodesulfurarchaeum sp. HSR-GB]|uniref:tripartite tricarboxylate transporter permease n=1 Tax=Halodesulfurarchaeum sp. HSR-GB TaxID=3074077 RepID=UPI002854800E|nr:tripartite tricarboxylate transporter permease [Halodesulfurarchaeum sp. HSR-GB]MDR5656948.1 tripartite tricarboxylate transporter permease [Halodesulfurarchaeum sp. HSR-GB]